MDVKTKPSSFKGISQLNKCLVRKRQNETTAVYSEVLAALKGSSK